MVDGVNNSVVETEILPVDAPTGSKDNVSVDSSLVSPSSRTDIFAELLVGWKWILRDEEDPAINIGGIPHGEH